MMVAAASREHLTSSTVAWSVWVIISLSIYTSTYIAPHQGNYSEALPAQARPKRRVRGSIASELRVIDAVLHPTEIAHLHNCSSGRTCVDKQIKKLPAYGRPQGPHLTKPLFPIYNYVYS